MNWPPGDGVETSISLVVGDNEAVRLFASRADGFATVVIGDYIAEIGLERVHVEQLRDQVPVVLAGLDRTDADKATCAKAYEAASRATALAKTLMAQAAAAELAGEPAQAAELRTAAATLRTADDAVDLAVTAVENAAAAADRAAAHAMDISARRNSVALAT